jgi:diadenylate cyclase
MIDWLPKLRFLAESLEWRALLDAGLLGLGLLLLYRALSRTPTRRLVIGIAVAGMVLLLARMLDLQGVMWVYRYLSPVVLIAVVVVFQPELRRVFERAALWGSPTQAHPGGIADVIAEALDRLAQRSCGALVVLPGRETIEGLVSGGVMLHAEPSVVLLLSIFDPNSPGHDGAVTIVDGRIEQMGVRLPLSRSDTLSADFGTRHNAALGLSEVTDALVLAVSEERGTLSAFSHGERSEVHSPAETSRLVSEHWTALGSAGSRRAAGPRQLRFGLQLATCLIAGLFVWAAIVIPWGEIVERSFPVAVEFRTPAHLALIGEKPASLTLYVSGGDAAIDSIDDRNLRVTFDLLEAQPGKQTLMVNEENVRLPPGVRLLDVEPPQFDVVLGAFERRELPVRAQLVGALPDGLVLEKVVVVPKQVLAVTPLGEDGDDTGRSLTTTPIYLQSVTESTRIHCKIIAPAAFQPVDRRWPDVEVRLSVAPK